MAKFKIAAGAEIDLITQKEMRTVMKDTMTSWMTEVAKGARYSRFSANKEITGGAVELTSDLLKPAPGFVWDVRRLRVTGLVGADVCSVYTNDVNPASLIATTADVPGDLFLWAEQLVLYPGDSIIIAGSGLAATGRITVSGQVRELPISLAWRLGG